MNPVDDPNFWDRLRKSPGILGGVAVVLVVLASGSPDGFDFRVFGLSGLALLLAWAQSWVLVPASLRHARAETDEWNRDIESVWKYVDGTFELVGADLDALRALFRAADDAGARKFIAGKWGGFVPEEQQDYLRFFNEQFMNVSPVYLDLNGRLRAFDP